MGVSTGSQPSVPFSVLAGSLVSSGACSSPDCHQITCRSVSLIASNMSLQLCNQQLWMSDSTTEALQPSWLRSQHTFLCPCLPPLHIAGGLLGKRWTIYSPVVYLEDCWKLGPLKIKPFCISELSTKLFGWWTKEKDYAPLGRSCHWCLCCHPAWQQDPEQRHGDFCTCSPWLKGSPGIDRTEVLWFCSWSSSWGAMGEVQLILAQTTSVTWPGPAERVLVVTGNRAVWLGMWCCHLLSHLQLAQLSSADTVGQVELKLQTAEIEIGKDGIPPFYLPVPMNTQMIST